MKSRRKSEVGSLIVIGSSLRLVLKVGHVTQWIRKTYGDDETHAGPRADERHLLRRGGCSAAHHRRALSCRARTRFQPCLCRGFPKPAALGTGRQGPRGSGG